MPYLEEMKERLKKLIKNKKVIYLKIKASIKLLENLTDLVEKEGTGFTGELRNTWERFRNLMDAYIDTLDEIRIAERDIEGFQG